MTDYAAQRKVVKSFIDCELSLHRLAKSESKSWNMRHKSGSSHFAYSVTWAFPGSLSLAGDIGELTISHYHAMPTWWQAVHWFCGNRDHDYHLGKSSAKKQYDHEATAKNIIEMLEQEADDIEVDHPRHKISDRFDRMDIFKVCVSDEAKDQINSSCSEGEHAAAELCSDLRLSDYYGTQNWSNQSLIQMAAIYHWAAMVYQTPEFKEACERAADDAELAYQTRALDQKMPNDRYAHFSVGMGDFIKHTHAHNYQS